MGEAGLKRRRSWRGSSDAAKFIEFFNAGRDILDLGSLILRSGSDESWGGESFRFPPRARFGPGMFLVLVRDPAACHAIHPDGPIDGLTGRRLNNSSVGLRCRFHESMRPRP